VSGGLSAKGRVGMLQADAAESGDGMDIDVSPSMAAAAAAMAGLASLNCNSSGGGITAGGGLGPAAAAGAGLEGSASPKKAARTYKFMRYDKESSGGRSGCDNAAAWQQPQQPAAAAQPSNTAGASTSIEGTASATGLGPGAQEGPAAAEAAAAAAAMTAVATAGMLAGSLSWGRQWYGGSIWVPETAAVVAAGMLPSHSSAAATAAYAGHMGTAAAGFDWGGLGQAPEEQVGGWPLGQTMQGDHSAIMPWPAQLAGQQQQQQQLPKACRRSSAGATGESEDSLTYLLTWLGHNPSTPPFNG
jgi:hypothetical protein